MICSCRARTNMWRPYLLFLPESIDHSFRSRTEKIARKFVRSRSISLSGADGKRTSENKKYHAHMCMSKVLRFGIRFHHKRTNVRHTGPLEAKHTSCGDWFAIYVHQKSLFFLPRHRLARPVCECVPYRSTFMIECSTSPGRLATYAVSR